ncbi:AhpD family alkylhydroperoxidase [Chitinophaga skermanii]|uniref:AhpD family alkylhydroperoxidase n=1 Tax=Chitinophaga skermanii TaxID=331697 RepID=A0A327QAX1_9BACT|nr:carboxymuconolactone decarboxylase family protein [Chitinophaga skermanii]RAJ00353.1 AhpD family alkylhydroperoxidase [Chitinophaga skermanii]
MEPRITFQQANKGAFDGLFKTEMHLKNSGIDHKLFELLKYRVSQINGCAYCLDMHHKEAIHLGDTEQRLHGLAAWREAPYYSDEERAVLAFAEALTHCEAPNEVYEPLTQFFTPAQIVDITIAVAQINMWNRLNIAWKSVAGTYKVGMF